MQLRVTFTSGNEATEELGEAEGKETIQKSAGVDRGHEAQPESSVRPDWTYGTARAQCHSFRN